MREKQCKYVNGFVYSFYLFFSSLLLRHLWLCAAVPLCPAEGRIRAICWGRPLAQSHRAPGEVLAATFDTTAARDGAGRARGFDAFLQMQSSAVSPSA